jgi:hypothetical protein
MCLGQARVVGGGGAGPGDEFGMTQMFYDFGPDEFVEFVGSGGGL